MGEHTLVLEPEQVQRTRHSRRTALFTVLIGLALLIGLGTVACLSRPKVPVVPTPTFAGAATHPATPSATASISPTSSVTAPASAPAVAPSVTPTSGPPTTATQTVTRTAGPTVVRTVTRVLTRTVTVRPPPTRPTRPAGVTPTIAAAPFTRPGE